MDLRPRKDEEAFRAEVRAFLAEAASSAPRGELGPESRPALIAWQDRLIERGYAARTIPRVSGGYGAAPDPAKATILRAEFARGGAHGSRRTGGLDARADASAVGRRGADSGADPADPQGRADLAPGPFRAQAGSDRAAVGAVARDEGDAFVAAGRKIWTATQAHLEEVGRFVARTAGEVHGGVGFTDALGLHLWFNPIEANRQLGGALEAVRRSAARLLGLSPAETPV